MITQTRVLRKRILIAEDDRGARESLSLLLRIDRHEVVEATNGREALELFTKEPFDLVIVDYAMPEMHGNELALNIKRFVPAQPILMITAYSEKLVDSNIPVDAVLSKPFGVDELRRALAKLLR
jgi:two-component system, cell cycle response regulator